MSYYYFIIIRTTSPKLNYGALVRINGTMADSFPNTIEKQLSALCNNSFLVNELEQPFLRK